MADAAAAAIAPQLPEGFRQQEKLFDLRRGLGDDACGVAADEEANESILGYDVLNTYGAGAERERLIDFSSGQTNLRFRDGVGGTPAPRVIDTSTALRQFDAWHPRGRQQLPNRIFHANGDLARGNPDLIDADTAVAYGADTTFSRHDALAEVSIDRFHPAAPADVQRDEHIIESWWVRGGENTREAARTLARVGDARVFGP